MTKILCVIPSRLQSTRLPRKPLVLIKDKPMVQWVYEAANSCKDFHKVIVATDAKEIAQVIESIGGHAEMTPSELKTGSDRVAFIAQKFPEYDVIVNLQGDEPFVTADMLSALVAPYINNENILMTTLAAPLDFDSDYHDPNTVKVIYDKNHDAIYFSRSPIPFFRESHSGQLNCHPGQLDCHSGQLDCHSGQLDCHPGLDPGSRISTSIPIAMHLGLYAYKRDFLLEYTKFEQTPLEKAELLEQLRALENGYKIRVCFTNKRIIEINTPEDLQKANIMI